MAGKHGILVAVNDEIDARKALALILASARKRIQAIDPEWEIEHRVFPSFETAEAFLQGASEDAQIFLVTDDNLGQGIGIKDGPVLIERFKTMGRFQGNNVLLSTILEPRLRRYREDPRLESVLLSYPFVEVATLYGYIEAFFTSKQVETVFVPDLDATAITAFAMKECGLTFLAEDYEKWNYLVDLDGKTISGRGKRFEVLTWKPDRAVSSDEVREYFREKGFYGHIAAFTAWIAEHSPSGYHASIPEDNACLGPSTVLRVPCSYFDGSGQKLSSVWVEHIWDRDWCFVAFREL